jgi:uncharacterized membrane protein
MKPAGKSTALLAYIPFVGFMIAFFVNREDHDPFPTWHIKNAFGLFILFVISLVIMNEVNTLAGDILWLIALFLWIFSFIMALKDKEIGVPGLGDKFQKWFTFLD